MTWINVLKTLIMIIHHHHHHHHHHDSTNWDTNFRSIRSRSSQNSEEKKTRRSKTNWGFIFNIIKVHSHLYSLSWSRLDSSASIEDSNFIRIISIIVLLFFKLCLNTSTSRLVWREMKSSIASDHKQIRRRLKLKLLLKYCFIWVFRLCFAYVTIEILVQSDLFMLFNH
jgi:hypothetical protein